MTSGSSIENTGIKGIHRSADNDLGQHIHCGWRYTTLGDVVDIKHGFAFRGEFIRDRPVGDVLLTPGNFAIGGGFKGDKLKYYDGPVPEEFVLQPGDLLVTMTDLSKNADTLGFPACIPTSRGEGRYLHNQRLGKVIVKDTSSVSPRYIYYLLCGRSYRHEVLAGATGTTVKHTSPERIKRFRFLLPSLPEQLAIAHILGALDDKIDLNRRMNETLEAMAQALFKSWFIDFDPVHAKVEGRDPRLPPDVAALFPVSLEDSELGQIPRGWEVKAIGDLANVVGGGTPSTKEPKYWSGGSYLWATPKDLSDLSFPILVDTAKHVTDVGLLQISSGLLPTGTVLLSSRAPIGYLAIAERPTAINQGFIAMLPKENVSNMFLLLWAEAAHDDILSRANGSTFLEINKSNFRPIPLVAPTPDIMAAFDREARRLYDRIAVNVRESDTLATLRDALLPRLLSGRLRVGSVEQLVEARS
jgi:type I restriction enzyme S subunit